MIQWDNYSMKEICECKFCRDVVRRKTSRDIDEFL